MSEQDDLSYSQCNTASFSPSGNILGDIITTSSAVLPVVTIINLRLPASVFINENVLQYRFKRSYVITSIAKVASIIPLKRYFVYALREIII